MNIYQQHASSILILIPCYNEEENIKNMISQLKLAINKIVSTYNVNLDILIVNDGSNDKTSSILQSLKDKSGLNVVHHEVNYGYGKTLRTGFLFAIDKGYDWVISFDMDGQHEPGCLYRFIAQIQQANSDLSLISGSRYKNSQFFLKSPWKDRFLVNCIISIVLAKYHIHVTDAFCGMKAFRVQDLQEYNLSLDGYEMPLEQWMKMKKNDQIFVELDVPLIYKDREHVFKQTFTDEEILDRALKRVNNYIFIINNYTNNPILYDKTVLSDIISQNYHSIINITAENYKLIWDGIKSELHNIFRRENVHEETRCPCCRCTSGRC